MKNKTTKYEPATELFPLNFEDMGDGIYEDGYEADEVSDYNELRADANYHLASLFVNNILKIKTYESDVLVEVVDLLYSDKSFQQIEKIIRKQFNIKK